MSERCLFCGWKRVSSFADTKFFAIPKEPGIKRFQWLHAIGSVLPPDQKLTKSDKVCSLHFRSGKSNNDSTHEDFVPHLYLKRDCPPTAEVMSYLNASADDDAPVVSGHRVCLQSTSSDHGSQNAIARKPNILRKRKIEENATTQDGDRASVLPSSEMIRDKSRVRRLNKAKLVVSKKARLIADGVSEHRDRILPQQGNLKPAYVKKPVQQQQPL